MSAAERRTYARVERGCVHETLYSRGARASLMTGAGVLPALGFGIVRGYIESRARPVP